MIFSRVNCKILYLFLGCSEFYLPALVGHPAAALVNRPNHVISPVSAGVSAGRGRTAPAAINQHMSNIFIRGTKPFKYFYLSYLSHKFRLFLFNSISSTLLSILYSDLLAANV